jgi:hypothetical protein
METAMKKLAIAFGLVLTAVVAGGAFGMIGAEIAVAGCIAIVASTAVALVLTSRPAPAPVGYVPPQRDPAKSEGLARA